MSQENTSTDDRLTYSESRTLNMGDYESTQCFFSFSTTVKERYAGKKSVTIKESSTSQLMRTTPESFNKVANKLIKRVRTVLDTQEIKLRSVAISKGFNPEEENEQKLHYLKMKKRNGELGE